MVLSPSLPEGTGNILIHDVYCSYFSNQRNAAQHVLRCNYYTGSGFCSHSDDMAIECGVFRILVT